MSEDFIQKKSIARRLNFTILLTSFLFLFEFAGLYFFSRTSLQELSQLHQTVQLITVVRQARQLIGNQSSFIDQTDPLSIQKENRKLINSVDLQVDELMQKTLALSHGIPEIQNLIEKSIETYRLATINMGKVFSDSKNWKSHQLIADQYVLETQELLNKAQIDLSKMGDDIFNRVYQNRFTPLVASFSLALIFLVTALWLGFSVTHRLNLSIQNLLNATQAVSTGNLAFQAPIIEKDEVGKLTHAFNQMTSNLQQTTVSRELLLNTNKELESFSYSVSHDLRAPLRGVDGFSQALIEDYGNVLDEQGKNYLNRIRTSIQKMGGLIDDILNLSRLSRLTMNIKKINLSALAQEVADRLQNPDAPRKVTFVIAPNVEAFADEALMRIAFENLFGNAWKYTSKHETAVIEFGTTHNNGLLCYFIRDNGAGFDMTYANKLFTPFQRLHTSAEFPGSGVGLATIQRIIHRHGGKIWVESAIEQGTTFYFTLA